MTNISEIYAALSASVDNGYNALVELLKEQDHQFVGMPDGKGYTIYAYEYTDYGDVLERKVAAVRLEEDEVQIYVCRRDKDITEEDLVWKDSWNDDFESFRLGRTKGYWNPLKSDYINYISALFNILENISGYLSVQ